MLLPQQAVCIAPCHPAPAIQPTQSGIIMHSDILNSYLDLCWILQYSRPKCAARLVTLTNCAGGGWGSFAALGHCCSHCYFCGYRAAPPHGLPPLHPFSPSFKLLFRALVAVEAVADKGKRTVVAGMLLSVDHNSVITLAAAFFMCHACVLDGRDTRDLQGTLVSALAML